MKRTIATAVGMAVAVLSGSASAQLVLPPTEAPRPSDPFKIPPRPVGPSPTTNIGAKPPAPVQEPLPDLPFEKFWLDGEGKLKALTEPTDYAAVRVNPMLDDATRAKIMPVLEERRARLEKSIVDNLDLMEAVDGGLLDRINLADRASDDMKLLNAAIKALRLKPLATDIKERNIVSAQAMKFHDKIVREYTQSLMDPNMKKQADKEAKRDAVGKLGNVLKVAWDESTHAYHGLLNETATRFAEASAKSGLSGEGVSALGSAFKSLPSDGGRIQAIKDALGKLSMDERRALLRGTVESRAAK